MVGREGLEPSTNGLKASSLPSSSRGDEVRLGSFVCAPMLLVVFIGPINRLLPGEMDSGRIPAGPGARREITAPTADGEASKARLVYRIFSFSVNRLDRKSTNNQIAINRVSVQKPITNCTGDYLPKFQKKMHSSQPLTTRSSGLETD